MPDCSCNHCAAACERIPGVFHPVEALRAIRAGLADDLMMGPTWDDVSKQTVNALFPRSLGHYDGRPVRGFYETIGRCVFFNVDRLCEIHDSGFKPMECRHAMLCGDKTSTGHIERVAWTTPVGRRVIEIWKRERAKQEAA